MTQFVAGEEEATRRAADWNYLVKNVKSKQNLVDIKSNAKNSQFAQPLFEFSGACAGCGEILTLSSFHSSSVTVR